MSSNPPTISINLHTTRLKHKSLKKQDSFTAKRRQRLEQMQHDVEGLKRGGNGGTKRKQLIRRGGTLRDEDESSMKVSRNESGEGFEQQEVMQQAKGPVYTRFGFKLSERREWEIDDENDEESHEEMPPATESQEEFTLSDESSRKRGESRGGIKKRRSPIRGDQMGKKIRSPQTEPLPQSEHSDHDTSATSHEDDWASMAPPSEEPSPEATEEDEAPSERNCSPIHSEPAQPQLHSPDMGLPRGKTVAMEKGTDTVTPSRRRDRLPSPHSMPSVPHRQQSAEQSKNTSPDKPSSTVPHRDAPPVHFDTEIAHRIEQIISQSPKHPSLHALHDTMRHYHTMCEQLSNRTHHLNILKVGLLMERNVYVDKLRNVQRYGERFADFEEEDQKNLAVKAEQSRGQSNRHWWWDDLHQLFES
uniref:Uncharacterized protein n=1 Tax=Percolomonas cosmopolitus TaxID=63605 RepID=A0A7S1KT91_9EUKA